MTFIQRINEYSLQSLKNIYENLPPTIQIHTNYTNPEFIGDFTIVLFNISKTLKKNPIEIGEKLGENLIKNNPSVFLSYNLIKGFLNLSINPDFWLNYLQELQNGPIFEKTEHPQKIMIEFSSPNTNKPLHLGHLRNNFLGQSLSKILEKLGHSVFKTCIVNNRGIHICKSMIAWQKFGLNKTPVSEQKKGDHFVGDYYVKFNEIFRAENEINIETIANELKIDPENNFKQLQGESNIIPSPIMAEAQSMLLKWEQNDPETRRIWSMMNEWVYAGFSETYQKIGTSFDKIYYESDIYNLGKELIEEGIKNKIFYTAPDGSVWINLTNEGFDEKLVKRKDNTAVYITQDIALANLKQKEFNIDKSIYIVGDEQNYHFQVLKLICEKLKLKGAEQIYHLSYGMVELTTGKMKSREGTVVDADDIITDMINIAKNKTEELSKIDRFTQDELTKLYNIIGIGALKFFLLRVNPANKMIFNPDESIDFKGFTAPFIQYTYTRIHSVLEKNKVNVTAVFIDNQFHPIEIEIIKEIEKLSATIQEAANLLDPSKIANYVFNIAKIFNHLYAELPILKETDINKYNKRIFLTKKVGEVIACCMDCLHIDIPTKM